MRGHLQCRDTLAGNEGCPLKTGTTVYVVGVTDMSLPSERQFSSLELSAIIVVAVCVVCVLYMWLVLQTCRSPLMRDSSVPWSCPPSSW